MVGAGFSLLAPKREDTLKAQFAGVKAARTKLFERIFRFSKRLVLSAHG